MTCSLAPLVSIAAALTALGAVAHALVTNGGDLRPVESFDAIRDPAKRSAALFTEAGKVIQHPRCMNCHPVTRVPTQGDNFRPHVPPMTGGAGDHGAAGLPCATCHGKENVRTFSTSVPSMPGNPHWGLAPLSMGWQGVPLGKICEQIKDPKRNGARSLAQIVTHMGEDHLVGWAWHPGEGRIKAPGTQAEFGKLIAAWVATGAHCPTA